MLGHPEAVDVVVDAHALVLIAQRSSLREELVDLNAFLTVAEERSFTRAAKRLGVSTSALSHAIRGLEERFGVRLLARTTRSVAPTAAGEQLLARLQPALGDIRGALELITGLRDRPAGRVRLVVSPLATSTVLAPKLGRFARDYPDVVLDVTTSGDRLDLVAAGFDAGIHLMELALAAAGAGGGAAGRRDPAGLTASRVARAP